MVPPNETWSPYGPTPGSASADSDAGTAYHGKTMAELGLTQDLESSGAFSKTIVGIGDKYMIDIYGNMITHKVERTPLLTIMANLGTVSEKPPYIVWNDEYSGEMWWDIAIDTLRQRDTVTTAESGNQTLVNSGYVATRGQNTMPFAVNDAGYAGGVLQVMSQLAAPTLGNTSIWYDGGALGTIAAHTFNNNGNYEHYGACFCPTNMSDTNRVAMVFKRDNSTSVGMFENVWNRIDQLFQNMRYSYEYATGSSIYVYRYNYEEALAHAPVYMAFDELHVATADAAIADGALTKTVSTYNEVFVLINKIGMYKDASNIYLFIELDFDVSNISVSLRKYVAYSAGASAGVWDQILVSIPKAANSTYPAVTKPHMVFWGTSAANVPGPYIGKMSRMLNIGRKTSAPGPIPEGDNFVAGGNFTAWRERITNVSQIFATPKYGITGTHQASQFRFGDDFQKTRAMWMELYKGWKESACMFGIKGETVVTSSTGQAGFMLNQPVRQMGGLMDYALFPINYMKKPFDVVNYASQSTTVHQNFITWLDELADNLTAFQINAARDLTFLTSKQFIRKLIPYTRSIQNNGVIMGGSIQLNKPSQLTFGLEVFTFLSSSGKTIKFIHEPALDTLPTLPIPYWIFGAASINPREVIISIDTANIKQVICRPDRIYGNIQDIGQDAFLEGMRGESSFILRYPKNHSIIHVPDTVTWT